MMSGEETGWFGIGYFDNAFDGAIDHEYSYISDY